jgi:hypothetical protein
MFERDPDFAIGFFMAQNNLRKSVVVGWEGIQDKAGKPIVFSAANFHRLLQSKAVLSRVSDVVDDHFNNRIKDEKLGESPEPSQGSSQGDSTKASNSPESSASTAGDSQQDNSQQG